MSDHNSFDEEQGTPRPPTRKTPEGKESAAQGGGGALKSMWMAASHRHWIAVCFAVGCPLLVNHRFSGSRGVLEPGTALLPAIYMLHWLFRDKFYKNLYMLPLTVVAMVAVNRSFGSDGDGAGNVLPSLGDGTWGDAPSPMGFSDGQRMGVTRRWGDSPGLDILMSVIPSLSLVFHYGMVWLATKFYKSKRGVIEISCDNFSNFLLRKCYGEMSLPTWLYMKKSRVLPSIANILKILISVSMIIATIASLRAPSDVVGLWYRPSPSDEHVRNFAWVHFVTLCLEETMFHCFIVLSGNFHKLKLGIRVSFAEHAVMMTYWEWYFIGLFSPTQAIWLPIMMMWIRFIPVGLSRLHDKSEMSSTAIAHIEFLHGILLFSLHFTGAAYIPHALIYRQLSNGIIRMEGYVNPILKRRKIYKSATDPASCKIYLPVGHSEIDCAHRRWMASVPLINKGPINLPACACGRCTAVYYPAGELKLERKEYRMCFDEGSAGEWQLHVREIQMPGAWIVITAGKCAGIKMSPVPIGTALEGQFRVIHSLVDTKGCLRGFGEFDGNLFVAKRYKKDPDTGYELNTDSEHYDNEALRNAAHNRHQRLSEVYFKDTLMSEKAAEFARAFNEIKILVRSIQVMRSVVMELEYESEKPLLYVVERYLEGSQPFQKFNNNDYVPGHHSKVNTPNMFSLFTYFASKGELLLCDVQGKGNQYTDMQFHTSTNMSSDESSDFASDVDDGPQYDWLHGDGGLELQKNVLVGLFQQRALHTLARRVWPAQVSSLSKNIAIWLSDPQFSQVIKELERKAQIYSVYFTTLSPVMMTQGMAGTYYDQEKSLNQRIEQSMHGMTDSPRDWKSPSRSNSHGSNDQKSVYAQSHEWDTVPATKCCGLLPGFTTRIVPRRIFPTFPIRTFSANTAPRKSSDGQVHEDRSNSMMNWTGERREERREEIAIKRQQSLQKVMQDENDSSFSPFLSTLVMSAQKSSSKSNLQKSRSAHKVPRLPALVKPKGKVQNVSDEEEGNATMWGATGSAVSRRLPSVKTEMIDDDAMADMSLRDRVPRTFSTKRRKTPAMQGASDNSFGSSVQSLRSESGTTSMSHGSILWSSEILRSSPDVNMKEKSPVLRESRSNHGLESELIGGPGVVYQPLSVASPSEAVASACFSDIEEELTTNVQDWNIASYARNASDGLVNGNCFPSVKSDATDCPNPPSQPDKSTLSNPCTDELGHQEDGMLP